MSETVAVRKGDLRLLMQFSASAMLTGGEQEQVNEALARCGEALASVKDGTGESAPPALPPGEFSRVELPGYVSWTGWVAEETYAGAGVLVVRDISGAVLARVSAGAFRQVIPMPTPKPGGDGRLALAAGDKDIQECPDHGDTLIHAEDEPGWVPGPMDDEIREHLVCRMCDYEVRA
jgi:hypothetical protein